jgi:large subunit ribosomal protein L9
MQVLLTQNVAKLGRKGDIKNVKSGYYRNFLCPRGFATIPTTALLKWAEEVRKKTLKEREEIVKQATMFKQQLEEKPFEIKVKTTDKDTLYGSIGEKEIVELLAKEAHVKLDKKQIELKENIKTVGKHKINIELSEEVKATVILEVSAKEKEKTADKAKKTKKAKK